MVSVKTSGWVSFAMIRFLLMPDGLVAEDRHADELANAAIRRRERRLHVLDLQVAGGSHDLVGGVDGAHQTGDGDRVGAERSARGTDRDLAAIDVPDALAIKTRRDAGRTEA